MKNLLIASGLLLSTALVAQKLPQPSPKGTVKQTVGVTDVTINYSRPSVKGRAVFGDLVPFDKIWRTGANSATTIAFDGPVKIDGIEVPAGEYAVLTTPGPEGWVLMLNKNLKVSGSNGYTAAEDVLTSKMSVKSGEFTEMLTFTFDNVKDDAADVTLRWEKTMVSFHLEAPATEQSLVNIEKALAEKEVSAGVYGSAASFCVERKVRLEEALEWAKKSVEMDPKFYFVRTLSLAYEANGMRKEAIDAAERSLILSKEAGNDAYVKMNEEKLAEWRSTGK